MTIRLKNEVTCTPAASPELALEHFERRERAHRVVFSDEH